MKNVRLKLMVTPLFCLLLIKGMAQNTITGIVTTDSIKGLAGVSVEIQGTTVVTLTDQYGRYGISAGDEAVLVFRLQGYITQEVPVHGRTQLNVILQKNSDSPARQSLQQFIRKHECREEASLTVWLNDRPLSGQTLAGKLNEED